MTGSHRSKEADRDGMFHWTDEENSTWETLITRQLENVEKYAHPRFLEGLAILDLPLKEVPQHASLDAKIYDTTGWHIKSVPALIEEQEFFHLLANRIFPVTSFIRKKEEIDYIEEPDIFHEVFGHIPLLIWKEYGDFLERFGKIFLSLTKKEQIFMGRIFWFTIEFGLVQESHEVKVFGSGILSSFSETPRSIDAMGIKRIQFNLEVVAHQTYEYDKLQNIYFVLENFEDLFSLEENKLRNIFIKMDTTS